MGYEYDFRGIKVRFPFDAYDCQKIYMRRVIHALQENVNALLESPTGTGKTLCLLCATLAWREAWAIKNGIATDKTGIPSNIAEHGSTFETEAPGRLPTIVYVSRTHVQLQQVAKELKRSGYKCKLSVLASRDQMCIHDKVSKLSGASLTAACRLKVKHDKCHFRNTLANFDYRWFKEHKWFRDEILDIEELVALGKEHQICPYFYSRKCHEDSDLILLPYNYLIDPSIYDKMGIVLKDAILLIDEAHNIEDVCSAAYSFDFTTTQLANAIEEAQISLDILDRDPIEDCDPSDFERVKAILLSFEEKLCELNIPANGLTQRGTFIRKMFSEINVVDHETKKMFLEQIDKCVEVLTAANETVARKGLGLKKFADALTVAFQEDCGESYRVHIHKEVGKTKSRNPFGSVNDKITLSLWCFDAGIAMKKLESLGVRSMILTSGTLSPMDSFATVLKVPFPIRLENKHVIHNNQVWIGVVDRGPCGQKLCSNFKSRSNIAYQEDLGKALVNIFRMVPNGLLVFFPSYRVMELFKATWMNVGLLERMNGIKPVVIEKRSMSSMKESLAEFKSKVNEAKGCALFAVMRGKLSEGMDFADKSARAVCIIGVPYPPWKDPWVILKKQYLDRQCTIKKRGLNGNQWYEQQASRATNQAIGRIIRHRYDYGAILFLDYRFNQPRIKNSISTWLRVGIRHLPMFGPINRELKTFFKETQLNYDSYLTSTKQPPDPSMEDNGGTSGVRIYTKARRHIKHITLKYGKDLKQKEERLGLMTALGTTLNVNQMAAINPPQLNIELKNATLAKVLSQSEEDATKIINQLNLGSLRNSGEMEIPSQSPSQSGVMVTSPKNREKPVWTYSIARRREAREEKIVETARKSSLQTHKAEKRKAKKAEKAKLNAKVLEDLKNELSPSEYKVFKNCLKVLRKGKFGMAEEYFIKHFFDHWKSIFKRRRKGGVFLSEWKHLCQNRC